MCNRNPAGLCAVLLTFGLLATGCADKVPLAAAIELVVTQQPAGTPLANAQVVAWPLEELDARNPAGWTDAAGHVAMVLPPSRGSFRLLIQQPPPRYVRERRRDFELIADPVHSWVFPLHTDIIQHGGTLAGSDEQDASAPSLTVQVIPAPKPPAK
jgi:hypothetical protein